MNYKAEIQNSIDYLTSDLALKTVDLQGSAYALPVSDRSFQAVFSVMVWHLLSDLENAASELSRVLTENGNFLIVTANPEAYSAPSFRKDVAITNKLS